MMFSKITHDQSVDARRHHAIDDATSAFSLFQGRERETKLGRKF